MNIADIKNKEVKKKAIMYAMESDKYFSSIRLYGTILKTPVIEAFDWVDTDDGYKFWQDIAKGKDLPLPKETEIEKRFTEQEFLQQFEEQGFQMFHTESTIKKLHRLEFLEELIKNNKITIESK